LELDTRNLSLANTHAALAELSALAEHLAENSQQVMQGDVLHKRPTIAEFTQHLSEIRQHAEQHAVRLQARMRRVFLVTSVKLDRCHVSTARVSQSSGRARRPVTKKHLLPNRQTPTVVPLRLTKTLRIPPTRFTLQQHPGPQPPNTPHLVVASTSIVIANKLTYVHRTWPARHVINAAMILVHSKQRRSPQEEVQCD
jgi:hypothetical protein